MILNKNSFTAALADKKKQIGLWITLVGNYSSEAVASSGYDWVLLDMEHSPNDLSSILSQLQVFSAYETTAIVRPYWNDSVLVKQLLDLGAPGLLFPMIQSAEEARSAVAATRYPPRGIRGVSGSTRANAFGRVKNYFSDIENETAVLVQLETLQALENANEIANVDGVSGVFFGPADIAADMGYIGQPMHADVWARIKPVAQNLINMEVPVGTLVMDPAFAIELLTEGFTFVACGSDASLLAKGADALLATVRTSIA